ncbi:MGMT family protein [Candidatus Pacearchaeota archaeon]|nr:MGMT family protein [Candidatus Pacearchaeota archaeon]
MKQISFSEKCYLLLRKVPKGKVTTYKSIANALGIIAYRAVGNAMNKNQYSPFVPCHRVVKSTGEIGGFSQGRKKKIEMLKKEGLNIKNDKIVDFEKQSYRFNKK